jgi:hypothetical protein
MPVRAALSDDHWFLALRNAAIRAGIYVGVAMSVVFTAWIVIANRVPFLERFAAERNVAAAALMILLAMIPAVRFFRMPGQLLVSGLIAWAILCLTYRVYCIYFGSLSDRCSTTQVFVLGAILYLIASTVSWLGTIVWRARASHVSHSNHHVS